MDISAGNHISLTDEEVRPKSILEAKVNPSNGAETQTFAIPLWPRWEYHFQTGSLALSPALAEERREVFECVWNSLRTRPDDWDARDACRFLLRHLAASAPDC